MIAKSATVDVHPDGVYCKWCAEPLFHVTNNATKRVAVMCSVCDIPEGWVPNE